MSRKGENITKRKDGRWEARVICAYDENRHAKYRYLYGKSYAEARAKKEFAQSQILLHTAKLSYPVLTLNEILSEFLLHKQMTVKPSTLSHYENLIRVHIKNQLGELRLMQLSSPMIEKYAIRLLQSGKRSGDGLSPKTVRDILSVLRSTFKYAIQQKYLPPEILNFSLPRYRPRQISVFSPEERACLEAFSVENGDSFRFGIYLVLYTGLRLGEICALRWEDIDLERAELHISHTIRRIQSNGSCKTQILITAPKTPTSVRSIPIPPFLKAALQAQKSHTCRENGYVLTGTDKYIEPSNYYMKYKRWLKKLNIPHRSFHTLRHTFATRCIEKGFDAKSLSEILGHTDVRITLNRYVHPSMESKRLEMELLTPAFFQTAPNSQSNPPS